MEFWHWLVLAAAFAVIEIAMPAMVCIWLAAAALGTAVIVWLARGIAWEHQALIFAAWPLRVWRSAG
jgi:membrane protein implicated in regulation of membrane protease activity